MKALKGLLAVCILYLFMPFTLFIYFQSYVIINTVDTSSYIRYATNGRYNEDVYFKKAVEEKVQIQDIIINTIGEDQSEEEKQELIEELLRSGRKQDVFVELLKNEKVFRERINGNEEYINYLEQKSLSVDELVSFMNKLIKLDELMLTASIYISSLIFIFLYYGVFKYRKRIYLAAATLYFMLVLDSFTGGLLSNIAYPYFIQVGKMGYEEYLVFVKGMLPAMREATLTFIIVDTVVQYYLERKNRLLSYQIKTAYYSLEKVLIGLNAIKDRDNIKVHYININFNTILNFCKKNKKDFYLNKAKFQIEENMNVMQNETMPNQIFEIQ
ncbi:hypothetical protein [Anaerotignum sp.]|uniref:hypothetical protein n=1 Tax=Anaerotignum sp. TaxID=2039241 RepID=UPI00289AF26F|nr:hypothetical protein [Anaerotignum sp.]